MKKLLAVVLCLVMVFSMMTAYAANSPLNFDKVEGGKVMSDGSLELIKGTYVWYPSVDFTNVKSVRMVAEPNWLSGWSGDLFEVRIDSPKGEIVGYIDLYKEGKNEFGCNVNVTGTHNMYIISTYAVGGSADIFEIYLSDQPIAESEAYVPVPEDVMISGYDYSVEAQSHSPGPLQTFQEGFVFITQLGFHSF